MRHAHFGQDVDWFATLLPHDIQHLVVDGYRRFYFDGDSRIRRMTELAGHGHGPTELALFIDVLVRAQAWPISPGS